LLFRNAVVCGALIVVASLSAAAQKGPIFPTAEQVRNLARDPDWGGLRTSCQADLNLVSHPIADFSPVPHYGSTGPVSNGKDAPESSLRRDSIAVYDLALCAEVSNDHRFSSRAEEILDNWAHTTKRIGTEQGTYGFNFYFPYALMGASLLAADASWHSDDFTKFVRNIVVPVINSGRPNNHGNWGVLLLLTSGGYLHDDAMISHARQRWLELMRSQIAEDGSLPLEICRSDTSNWCGGPTKGINGVHYTHWTLLPTTIAAEIFRNLGQDVYRTSEGQLLCKAYAKAATWTLHPETFPYFAANSGKLLGLYDVNYFYILQARCPTHDGQAVLDKYGTTAPDPLSIRVIYSGGD